MANWKKVLTALPSMTDLSATTHSTSKFLRGDGSWAAPSTGSNNYLDGVTVSGNTVTYSINGGTDVTSGSIFGSNAFNSTGFTANTGTVTGATGTAPVSVSSSSTSPVVSMAAASGSANGYLTSANWTTFNNKGSSNLAIGTTSSTALAGNTAVGDSNRSISDSISTTSSTISASATAVKAAYDRTWSTTNNVSSTGSYAAGTSAGPVLTFDGGSTATIPSAGSTASGIVTSGTQSFGGAKTFKTDVAILGNLSLTGTSTITNTTVEVLALEDNTVKLNAGHTGAAQDAGLLVEMGSSSLGNGTIYYDAVAGAADTTSRWVVGLSTSDVVTGSTYKADVMQVRIDGAAILTTSTEVPVGHMQYHSGELYLRVEN